MNTKNIKYRNVVAIFYIVLFMLSVSRGYSQEKATLATTEITLKGNAEGGILTLVEMPNLNSRYVSISTQSGESAESVAMRLADMINNSNSFGWGGGFEVVVKDGSLTMLGAPGTYAFAGTEKGLGIPEPPTSLSGMYDIESELVILDWENPVSGFDRIFIAKYGFPCPTYSIISGSEEEYVCQSKDEKINSPYFCIIGIRDGVPSSPAAIKLAVNVQEELFGIPFYNGVAPNWQAWHIGSDTNNIQFWQETRKSYTATKGNKFNSILHGGTKPFYQMIKTMSQNIKGGVYRKFLGLTPGHTYRISARLSTLAMDSTKSDWSFSFHAAHNGRSGANLTVEQLAGQKALPDGSSGPQAGQIALYQPSVTTEGKFLQRTTDDSGPGREITNITLPKGVDTITIWFRHTGANSTGVGFDWVKLEDVTEEITSLSDIADTAKDSADDAKPVEKACASQF